MKRSNRLLILVGFVLAAVAFVGVVLIANGSGGAANATAAPTPTQEPHTTVVIAKTNINLGDEITKDNVTTEDVTVSKKLSLGDDTFTTVDEVIGMKAGGSISKDSVLHKSSDFLGAGEMPAGQSIAKSIAPGMVAVSLMVDEMNGVGMLVTPGDHVDIILAMWVKDIDITDVTTTNKHGLDAWPDKEVTAKLIISDRKVLAVLLPTPTTNTNGLPNASATPAAKTGRTLTADKDAMAFVIVEVKPQEAEIIRYAQRSEVENQETGETLGLALRSASDNGVSEPGTSGVTFQRLVQLYSVLPPDPRGIVPPDLQRGIQW